MKTFTTASVVAFAAILGLSTMPSSASGDSDRTIHSHWEFSLENALRDRGVATARVEEWGSLIRAFVQNPDGSTSMQFFDPDTLQQVSR
jgi:hypothetical protein